MTDGYTCRFCGKEYEICTRLGATHERFCGGNDHLEIEGGGE